MAYGWEGEVVRLVPLDRKKHLENALLWLNNPEVTTTLGVTSTPLTRLQEEAYFDRAEKNEPTNIAFAIETLLEDRHIGFSGIHQISWVDRTAMTGSIIGDPADWGKGYGSDAVAIRTWYAFEVLNLRLLKSSYFGDNLASRKMNEKQGFREYGCLPDAHYRAGAYHKETFLYLTRDMWIAATGGRKPNVSG